MMAVAVCEKLKNLVTCGICREEFRGRDPRLLPCMHAFCCECLVGILTQSQKKKNAATDETILCPICKSEAVIPNCQPSDMPQHLYVDPIESVVKELEGVNAVCQACRTTDHKSEVNHYCFKCAMAMCSTCALRHHQHCINHVHIPIKAKELTSMMCKDHKNPVNTFCIECSKAVCQVCTVFTHYNHKTCDFTINSVDDLETVSLELANEERSSHDTLDKINKLQNKFNDDMNAAGEQLDRHYAYIINQLEKQYKELKGQLHDKQAEGNSDLNARKEKVIHTKNTISRLRENMYHWKKPLECTAEVKITGLMDVIPRVDEYIEKPKVTAFSPGHKQLSLGYTLEEDSSKSPIKPINQARMSYRIQNLTNIRNLVYLPNGMLVTSTSEVGLQVYDKGKCQQLHPLSGKCKNLRYFSMQQESGTITVLYNKKIEIFFGDDQNRCKTSFDVIFLPCAVGITTNDELIVLGRNSGSVEPVNEQMQVLPGVKGCTIFGSKNLGMTKIPQCGFTTCFMSSGHAFGVAESITNACTVKIEDGGAKSDMIYKYSIQGRLMWQKPLQDGALDICVDNQDRIIICYQNFVTVYDHSLEDLFSIQKENPMVSPCSVCTDSQDNIFVADTNIKAVLMFDSRGNYIKQILNEKEPLFRMALYNNEYLAIALRSAICVYKL